MGSVQSIVEQGWKQGSLFSQNSTELAFRYCEPRLPSELLQKRCHLIVISHDCDIINPSFDVEPWTDIICTIEPEHIDGNLLQLRNPRRLHFFGDAGGSKVLLEADIRNRCRIQRELLADCIPAAELTLPRDQLLCLIRWLVRRYNRNAFPDEFNRRIRSINERIKKTLARDPSAVGQILLSLDCWDELAPGEPYHIEVVGVISPTDYADEQKLRGAQEALMKLEDLLSQVEGIEVPEGVLLRSESEISMFDLRSFRIWDFESISLRDSDA